jgi:putative nucleotidyltransferase with HDIG domain
MEDKLDQYINGIKNLPPSPSLMVELIKLLKKPDRDIDQLVELMSHDPSLTAEILRRCNSAVFAADEAATDIFEATFRLGFYEVYRVATALFGARTIRWSNAKQGLPLEIVWEHSALTAVCAGSLAKEVEENEAVAFTAGLLHDVGKVVLACAEGADYANVVRQAGSGMPLTEAEKTAFGFNHAEIGGRLLGRWGLPPNVVTPIRFHHQPEQAAPFERLTAMLNLADSMAYCLTDPSAKTIPQSQQRDFSTRLLQLNENDLARFIVKAREEATHVKELFRVG